MRISDWSSDVCSSDLAEYDKLFKETYDGYTTVPYQAAQASAAVIVYKEAFEKANSFDTEAVRDALAALEMETFYGPIKFSEAGNNIRSEERRVGQEGDSTCRTRRSQEKKKKKEIRN